MLLFEANSFSFLHWRIEQLFKCFENNIYEFKAFPRQISIEEFKELDSDFKLRLSKHCPYKIIAIDLNVLATQVTLISKN